MLRNSQASPASKDAANSYSHPSSKKKEAALAGNKICLNQMEHGFVFKYRKADAAWKFKQYME